MADASAPADAGPPSGPSQPLDRIDELSDELIRRRSYVPSDATSAVY